MKKKKKKLCLVLGSVGWGLQTPKMSFGSKMGRQKVYFDEILYRYRFWDLPERLVMVPGSIHGLKCHFSPKSILKCSPGSFFPENLSKFVRPPFSNFFLGWIFFPEKIWRFRRLSRPDPPGQNQHLFLHQAILWGHRPGAHRDRRKKGLEKVNLAKNGSPSSQIG